MKFTPKQMVLALFALIILAWTVDSLYSQYRFHASTHREKLQVLWEQDVKKLELAEAVPPGWHSLKEITYFGGDPGAKNWIIEGLRAPHPVKKDGTHRLEVLLLSFEDEGRDGAIIQYNLVNLKNQNMEWELGRTFFLSGGESEWEEWVSTNQEKIKKLISAGKKKSEKQPRAENKPEQPIKGQQADK